MTDTSDPRDWRTSSFSGAQGDCVQLRHKLDAVRDSKNPHNPLRANAEQLVAAAKIVQFRR